MRKELYLRLSPKYILQIQPDGGMLIPKPSISLEKLSHFQLSEPARNFILELNKKVNLKEILLSFSCLSAAEVQNFIELGLSKNIFTLSHKPTSKTIEVIGSYNYFSPYHFIIELTDACNLACRHCYRDVTYNKGKFLETKKLLNILEQLRRFGVRVVELTGGEPTLHPRFKEIFYKSCQLFDVVTLITNGCLINKPLGEFLSKFKDKLLIQIDLDGPAANVHENLRGISGSFSQALRAMEILRKKDIIFRAVMNIYPDNLSYIEETLLLSKKHGATVFSCSPVLDVGRAQEMQLLDPGQLSTLFKTIKRLSKKYPRFFFPDDEIMRKVSKRWKNKCGAGSTMLVLGPTGKVRFCLILPEKEMVLGDLYKMAYDKFLSSANLERFTYIKSPSNVTCKDCQFEAYCKGCLARPFFVRQRCSAKRIPFLCKWSLGSGLEFDKNAKFKT